MSVNVTPLRWIPSTVSMWLHLCHKLKLWYIFLLLISFLIVIVCSLCILWKLIIRNVYSLPKNSYLKEKFNIYTSKVCIICIFSENLLFITVLNTYSRSATIWNLWCIKALKFFPPPPKRLKTIISGSENCFFLLKMVT